MARVANTEIEIAVRSLDALQDEVSAANRDLRDASDLVEKLTAEGGFTPANITAFRNKKLGTAKTHNSNAVALYRWILDHFSIPTPNALNDNDIDALDENIRTHEA